MVPSFTRCTWWVFSPVCPRPNAADGASLPPSQREVVAFRILVHMFVDTSYARTDLCQTLTAVQNSSCLRLSLALVLHIRHACLVALVCISRMPTVRLGQRSWPRANLLLFGLCRVFARTAVITRNFLS